MHVFQHRSRPPRRIIRSMKTPLGCHLFPRTVSLLRGQATVGGLFRTTPSATEARRNCRALPHCVTWYVTFAATTRANRAMARHLPENVARAGLKPV